MIAVIFEVWPQPGRTGDYLDLAAELRPLLASIEGFISIERFESLNQPGKILSLSFFESEEAVANWRRLKAHREAQRTGREQYFADYRLRIARVERDYGKDRRDQVPPDSDHYHRYTE